MKDGDFLNCLAYGKKGEYKAQELFEYDDISFSSGKCSEYDGYWVIDNTKVYFEVKRDKYIDTTNNICIEYECSGKASGIAVTIADYYLYMNDAMDEVYLIDVAYIKHCISTGLYHKDIRCGYKWKARAYLFNKSLFEKFLISDNNIKDGRDNTPGKALPQLHSVPVVA
jgi:hypothetical protein